MANKVKGKGSTRQNFLYSVYFVALCSFKTIIDPPLTYTHTVYCVLGNLMKSLIFQFVFECMTEMFREQLYL
jgi:hypothetical protein